MIQTLKDAGDLVLYHDYRSGHVQDLSGYANHGVMTDTIWNRNGVTFPDSTSLITVADSPELQLTEMTLIALGDFNEVPTGGNQRLISKRDSGGTNYDLRIHGTPRVELYDGTNNRTLDASIQNKKYIALNVRNGEKGEVFTDGISVGELADTSAISINDADLIVGNYYANNNNLKSTLKAVMIINRKLTATEHAELYAELESIHYPTKTKSLAQASIDIVPDSSLVGAWNMRPIDNKLIDISGEGHDSTLYGGSAESDLLGDKMYLDGASYAFTGVDPYEDSDFDTNGMTISFWMNPVTTTGYIFSVMGRIQSYFSANVIYFDVYDDSNAWKYAYANMVSKTGVPVYVVMTAVPNGATTLYIDGVAQTNTATMTTFFMGTNNRPLSFGSIYDGSNISNINLYAFQIHNEVKSQDWIDGEYARGNGQFHTDWGVNESVANVTSGFLENSPFSVDSGAFKITMDTIEGNDVKVIECITAGICYIPTSEFHQSDAEGAYGEWEWWMYKGTESTAPRVCFVSKTKTVSDGYDLQILGDETYNIVETGVENKLKSATGLITVATWDKYKVTRSSTGVFTAYLNDVAVTADSGNNPFTDTSDTTSKYILFDLDAGDKIAYSALNGDYSIIKKL